MAYWFFKWFIVGPALKLAFKVTVTGRENIPRRGAVILAANHIGFFDSPLIMIHVPRHVSFGAKKEYFEGRGLRGRLTRWFFVSIRQIPVDRNGMRASLKFIDDAIAVLRSGGAVGIHPEGTRSPDGRLYKPRLGVAKLACETGAPIIPIGITGATELHGAKLRQKVRIVVGTPIVHGEYAGLPRKKVAELIMERIQALSGQESAGSLGVIRS